MPGASSSSRGEKRPETHEATSVKKRLTKKSSTANTHVGRRAGQMKTDGENMHKERRRAHASGERGFESKEHGEHTPERRDQCAGSESLE